MLAMLSSYPPGAPGEAPAADVAAPFQAATAVQRGSDLPSPLPGILRRLPVLIVEDAHTCSRTAQAMLRKLGFEAVIVPNGYEAVAAIEQGTFEAVLMDLQMPLLDGLDATRLIRSRWPDRHLSIYALTGDSDAFPSCLIAGMNGIVTKPVQMSALADLFGVDLGP
jgi:CheY-like chemotaxis protein